MRFKVDWSGRSINYTKEEIDAVVEVMRNGDPQTQGHYLEMFENDFAQYVGSPHCFGVSNCTHALELCADLTGLKIGDEVIIPGHTYCASAIPFARTGATICWADIDPETFLVSLDSIRSLTNSRTKVIVVVHLYGLMCDVEAIAEFAASKNILLVEDCAQSLGAFRRHKSCGTFGDFGAFSFHAQKNISTMGEGGMLVVRDEPLADLIPGLRHNGHRRFDRQTDYWRPAMTNVDVDIENLWPHNFSLSEAQSALGSMLLKRINQLTAQRRKRATHFRESLVGFEELVFQNIDTPDAHSHHLLVARYDSSKYQRSNHDLIKILNESYGIKTIVQFYPLYRYDLFAEFGFGDSDCPNTDYFFDNMISFPFHLWMNDNEFQYLIESAKSALTELRC